MKKWEDENAGTFLVLRRKTGKLKDGSGIVLQHKDPVQEKRSKAKAEQKNFLHFM